MIYDLQIFIARRIAVAVEKYPYWSSRGAKKVIISLDQLGLNFENRKDFILSLKNLRLNKLNSEFVFDDSMEIGYRKVLNKAENPYQALCILDYIFERISSKDEFKQKGLPRKIYLVVTSKIVGIRLKSHIDLKMNSFLDDTFESATSESPYTYSYLLEKFKDYAKYQEPIYGLRRLVFSANDLFIFEHFDARKIMFYLFLCLLEKQGIIEIDKFNLENVKIAVTEKGKKVLFGEKSESEHEKMMEEEERGVGLYTAERSQPLRRKYRYAHSVDIFDDEDGPRLVIDKGSRIESLSLTKAKLLKVLNDSREEYSEEYDEVVVDGESFEISKLMEFSGAGSIESTRSMLSQLNGFFKEKRLPLQIRGRGRKLLRFIKKS